MATHAIKDAPIQRRQRIGVDIPVILTTVLESMEATIADLSEQGALIKGCAVPAGARVQIDYLGQTIYAQCRWGEVDRMGVQFVYPLAEGPLFERLQVARAAGMPRDMVIAFPQTRVLFGRRAH